MHISNKKRCNSFAFSFDCVYCLNRQIERAEILRALSRRMTLADDVNLDSVAAACEFFSGADLKALLYNSQLSALNDDDDALTADSSDAVNTGHVPDSLSCVT